MQIPRLRQWREFRALTQEEVAEKAGLSVRSVAGYEAGAGARPGTVRKLAAALDIDVADLQEASPKKGRTPLPTNWASSFPGEGFTRAVKEASTEELRGAMKQHVGNMPAQTLKDYRRDKASAMAAGVDRARVFAHALIVDEELRSRGDEPPEDYLPDYREYREMMARD